MLAVTVVAIAGMVFLASLQTSLLLKIVKYEDSLPYVLICGTLIGLWWLSLGWVMLQGGEFPSGLAWTGVIAGASGIMITAGFYVGGHAHPLAAAGFLVNAAAAPTWAVWIARLLSSGTYLIE